MAIEDELGDSAVLILVAHPDDETIGAGGLICKLRNPFILHVTDGAPPNLDFARAAGFQTRAAYAEQRERELACALNLGGIPQSNRIWLGLPDQTASLDLTGLVGRLYAVLNDFHPDAILTHAYEGGHPDHDATAFAVHATCRKLLWSPRVYEFTSYHAASPWDGSLACGSFLPGQDQGEVLVLSERDRRRKAQMVACFTTQAEMLRWFGVEQERFRRAPVYDFAEPPHSGRIFYDQFDFGMASESWLQLAREALRNLEAPAFL
jgi:LmbE family N-acetylglucosaminyl deacetylase